jgi:hypothetical protein
MFSFHLKEIITVLNHNNMVVGYLARRSVIFGFAQEIPDGYVFTKSIVKPDWQGNYPTKRDAVKNLDKEEKHIDT